MENIRAGLVRWLLVAGEWLMVSPAIVFLAAAALRAAQPAQYEPARTAGIVFEWISGMRGWIVTLLLVAMPTVAVTVGSTSLWRSWRRDETLRRDAVTALGVLERQLTACLLARWPGSNSCGRRGTCRHGLTDSSCLNPPTRAIHVITARHRSR